MMVPIRRGRSQPEPAAPGLRRFFPRIPGFLARNGWTRRHILAALALMTLGVLATLDAWRRIAEIAWKDEEASHIFLVPIVALWLVWVRRERLRTWKPTVPYMGPLLVAVGWFLYAIGPPHHIDAFWHGGAVLVLIGCLVSVLGGGTLTIFLPAFIVLGFLVPVPGMIRWQISNPLQTVTAQITHGIFEILGASVTRSGNALTVNGIRVEIVEACNGLRMVFALVLVSYAFAFGTPLKEYVRWIVVGLSPVSAILCNVVRIVPTVWVYGYFPREIGETFHNVTGWVMLPIAFLMLLGIVRALRWALVPLTHYTLAYQDG
jgi:exosortase